MTMFTKLTICLFIFVLSVWSQNPFMKKSTGYYNHLGAKTPYRNVANLDTTAFAFKGCAAKKVWMVIRHGTRYPKNKYINAMINILPVIKEQIIIHATNLSDDEIIKIRNWKPLVTEEDEKNLTHEGEDEMIDLAERMHFRFPDLFSQIYSNTTYKFKYTATQRTKESARNFATGLFGRPTSYYVWYPQPSTKDPILRFYKLCKKWRKDVKRNPEAMKERFLFFKSKEMNQTLHEMKKKLGFELDVEEIYLMYMTCAFETSWSKYKISPWCTIFSKDDLKVMEYSEDLKFYWIDGYGFNLTYMQACPAIRNLAEFFQSKEEFPKAVLYFTHSGTLLKLIAHLGLYKDEHALLHDSYTYQEERQWKVSKIDSFGTNLAFILYRCEDSDKMLVLHQERPVRLPGCLESDLCDFNTFKTTFNESINNCDFDFMCNNNDQ